MRMGAALPGRMRFIDTSGGSKWSAVQVEPARLLPVPLLGVLPDSSHLGRQSVEQHMVLPMCLALAPQRLFYMSI